MTNRVRYPILIAKPTDQDYDERTKPLKFKLKVKAYVWNIPKIIRISYLKQALDFVRLYVQICTEQETVELTDRTRY